MQGCEIPEKLLFGEVCKNDTPLYGVFLCVCVFLLFAFLKAGHWCWQRSASRPGDAIS